MSSLIISSASHSSPRIFIYHSSHIILIPSSFHSIIFAFFTFPLIHFTMVVFAISSKLIFTHFIYHTLLFIIPSSFISYFTSITLITTHSCHSFLLSSISIPILSFHSIASIPFNSNSFFDSWLSRVQWYPPSSLPTLFYRIHSYSHSSIFHSTHTIHIVSSLLIYVSQLWVLYHVCSDSFYRLFICCVDKKHSQSMT